MRIQIKTDLALGTEALSGILEDYSVPAFIVDNDLFIREKNTAASACPTMRKGRRLNSLLTTSKCAEIRLLRTGERLDLELDHNLYMWAVIFRAKDCYLLLAKAITPYLRSRTLALIDRLEGYESELRIALPRPESGLPLPYSRLLRFQSHVFEFVRLLTAGPSQDGCAFSATSLATSVFGLARELLFPKAVTLRTDSVGESVYTYGSQKDFAFLLSAMIANAISITCTDVRLSAACSADTGVFSVSFVPEMNEDDLGLLYGGYRTGDFSSEYGELLFDIYLMELIAESNLWDFCVCEDETSPDRVCFTLTVDASGVSDVLLLRDVNMTEASFILKRELCL